MAVIWLHLFIYCGSTFFFLSFCCLRQIPVLGVLFKPDLFEVKMILQWSHSGMYVKEIASKYRRLLD